MVAKDALVARNSSTARGERKEWHAGVPRTVGDRRDQEPCSAHEGISCLQNILHVLLTSAVHRCTKPNSICGILKIARNSRATWSYFSSRIDVAGTCNIKVWKESMSSHTCLAASNFVNHPWHRVSMSMLCRKFWKCTRALHQKIALSLQHPVLCRCDRVLHQLLSIYGV